MTQMKLILETELHEAYDTLAKEEEEKGAVEEDREMLKMTVSVLNQKKRELNVQNDELQKSNARLSTNINDL